MRRHAARPARPEARRRRVLGSGMGLSSRTTLSIAILPTELLVPKMSNVTEVIPPHPAKTVPANLLVVDNERPSDAVTNIAGFGPVTCDGGSRIKSKLVKSKAKPPKLNVTILLTVLAKASWNTKNGLGKEPPGPESKWLNVTKGV